MQAIKVWGHWVGPNPWKVRMLLEELELPYEWEVVEFDQVKKEQYLQVNPNGRLPTIRDPNTGITLWESGAIIQYLVEQYDPEGKILYVEAPNKYLCQQWLAFQISGQGPYTGQATWFARFHLEKVPSATDRYVNETQRIFGVLELGLERNGTGWLVGEKCTYADLAFVTWSQIGEGLLKELEKYDCLPESYPRYHAWMTAMTKRPAVAKALADIVEARKAHGLP